LRSDQYCTLINISVKHAQCVYLDSGSGIKKNYTTIKAVLDEALTKYARLGDLLKNKRQLKQGMHMFIHTTLFPRVKQPGGSHKEAYYALYQMRAYVQDHHNLTLPNSLKSWAEHLAMIAGAWVTAPEDSLCVVNDQPVGNPKRKV
jgi:hypothetical protein